MIVGVFKGLVAHFFPAHVLRVEKEILDKYKRHSISFTCKRGCIMVGKSDALEELNSRYAFCG